MCSRQLLVSQQVTFGLVFDWENFSLPQLWFGSWLELSIFFQQLSLSLHRFGLPAKMEHKVSLIVWSGSKSPAVSFVVRLRLLAHLTNLIFQRFRSTKRELLAFSTRAQSSKQASLNSTVSKRNRLPSFRSQTFRSSSRRMKASCVSSARMRVSSSSFLIKLSDRNSWSESQILAIL